MVRVMGYGLGLGSGLWVMGYELGLGLGSELWLGLWLWVRG